MLTVIQQVEDGIQPNGQRRARWLCQCDCGSDPVVMFGYSLNRKRNTVSCGCLTKKVVAERSIKYNKYDLSGEYGIGYTSSGDEFYFNIEDYDLIKDYCWYINNQGYVTARVHGENKHILMHNLIMGKYCDHINRKRNDNTRNNLREATFSENCQNRSLRYDNTSGVSGVYFDKNRNKWIANLFLNGKMIYCKTFTNREDAINARLKAEKQYYGEFAPQKHLYTQYNID